MTTLKDIAQEAGVSIMTVSNVINGNHARVSQGTIEKVNALVEKYNYVPNSAARMLSAKSSRIIALYMSEAVLDPQSVPDSFDNPYSSKLIGVIQQSVQEQQYYLMLCGSPSAESIVNDIKTWNAEGAIFLAGYDTLIPELSERLDTPMVFIDSYHREHQLMNIGADDYKGGYLAARYLVNAGHTSIGFASDLRQHNPLLRNRFHGFTDALKELGINFPDDHLFNADINYKGGIEIGKQLAIRRDISAIFSTADIMSVGIMEGARLGGLSLPGDLSVMGFDNLPLAGYVTPKLTTIHQDIEQKGRLVVNKLFQLIRNPEQKKEHIVMPVEIVERQSVMHR